MKLFASFLVTIGYAILLTVVYFAIQGLGNVLKAFGIENFIVGLIFVGYFAFIWRTTYVKMKKEV